MHGLLRLGPLAALVYLASASSAWAGNITAQGNVTALTNVNQLQGTVGTATFNEANNGVVPLGQYTPMGMTFYTGPLANILAGVGEPGSASQPSYQDNPPFFPDPIAGGGVATGSYLRFGGVVKFTDPITQFGLTGSLNGTQYITVWDLQGQMIGQVTWAPAADAAFVGIDTNDVPIGMLAVGNDNMWGGATYNIMGLTTVSDTWIWALGIPCQSDADCMDDENPCTLTECSNGDCLHPNDPQGVCPDDGNPCTSELCSAGECIQFDNNDPCDDADACTDFDTCVQGQCGGADLVCNDSNLCSTDSCDSRIGCVYDFAPGCCITDEDCMPGEICQLGSNSCIPDPDGTADTDTTASSTDEGTGTSADEGESSSGTESGDDEGTGTSADEIGDDASTFDTFGGPEVDDGCGCTTDERGSGALFGLLGLALLGTLRRR